MINDPTAPPIRDSRDAGGPDVVVPPGVLTVPAVAPQAPQPQLVRLSHTQWEASVRALLSLEGDLGIILPPDTQTATARFTNNVGQRAITQPLVEAWRTRAEELTARVVGDDTRYAALMAPFAGMDDAGRKRALIADLLTRAFRRPPSEADVAFVAGKFDAAAAAVAGDFREGVRAVVELVLQSPQFLYRIEQGVAETDRVRDGVHVRALDDWEYSARLAFALTDAPPDEALRTATARGELRDDTGRRRWAQRLMTSAAGRAVLLDLHTQLYGVNLYGSISKSQTLYPGTENIGADAAREGQLFLAHVLDSNGGLSELLTSRVTFANARLATLYGLAATGRSDDRFERVQLDEHRAGILTHVGWTAWRADTQSRRTIIRGVTVLHRVLCQETGTPPPNAQADFAMAMPPMGAVSDRAIVDFKTSGRTCLGCHHQQINPVGFVFEPFDAVGRYVSADHGDATDVPGELLVDNVLLHYRTAADFLTQAAALPAAHRCYVESALEYLTGAPPTGIDDEDARRIGEMSRQQHLPVLRIIEELVVGEGFRTVKS